MNCLNCQNPTNNPKFCSRSCAAVYNNKKAPKRKLGNNLCKCCKTPIKSGVTYCKDCFLNRVKDFTLEEVKYNNHHKSSAWALVRSRARSVCKDLPQICSCCGYSKHVEVCHIKPISSYPLETLISVVNSVENLLLLCPNCHWEFDNGLLEF